MCVPVAEEQAVQDESLLSETRHVCDLYNLEENSFSVLIFFSRGDVRLGGKTFWAEEHTPVNTTFPLRIIKKQKI